MKDKRRPHGTVRPVTKSEAQKRAMAAMQQRNEAIEGRRLAAMRLMELEIILATIVRGQGRMRLKLDDLVDIGIDGELCMTKDGEHLILEWQPKQTGAGEDGAGVAALLKGGFTVVEQVKGDG